MTLPEPDVRADAVAAAREAAVVAIVYAAQQAIWDQEKHALPFVSVQEALDILIAAAEQRGRAACGCSHSHWKTPSRRGGCSEMGRRCPRYKWCPACDAKQLIAEAERAEEH